MTVAEYAKHKGVSKQSVYDKLRRKTLSYEVIDGVKHILESSSKRTGFNALGFGSDMVSSKKLNKTLKKLNKVKHKLELAVNEIKALDILVKSKDSEIDSLKKSLGLFSAVLDKKLLQIESKSKDEKGVIDVKIKKNKKKRKKNK